VQVRCATFAYQLKLLLLSQTHLLLTQTRLKSRAGFQTENLALRQQVIVLSRKSQSRMRLRMLGIEVAQSTVARYHPSHLALAFM
jgi:hypothetical protein